MSILNLLRSRHQPFLSERAPSSASPITPSDEATPSSTPTIPLRRSYFVRGIDDPLQESSVVPITNHPPPTKLLRPRIDDPLRESSVVPITNHPPPTKLLRPRHQRPSPRELRRPHRQPSPSDEATSSVASTTLSVRAPPSPSQPPLSDEAHHPPPTKFRRPRPQPSPSDEATSSVASTTLSVRAPPSPSQPPLSDRAPWFPPPTILPRRSSLAPVFNHPRPTHLPCPPPSTIHPLKQLSHPTPRQPLCLCHQCPPQEGSPVSHNLPSWRSSPVPTAEHPSASSLVSIPP
ncbi:hypothetical protein FA13DRAFT_1806952 [Coprinellus micaceus]|uniref:Uncharacterized protein n=1 Tax=Coprinellus micaceus TaxID=71717 RepID=A0A4Y7RIT9_COPMI|nr:hypothetical protein FA13DRAFT_1806952 [Coprinellus micaceus]